VRVIAGEFGGRKGPAKTFSPINLWDVNLRAGKSTELPLPNGHTTTFLVLSGAVTVNGEREAVEGDLAIFARNGDSITVKAKTDAKLLVMDGEPIDEPVVGQGPFVMNSSSGNRESVVHDAHAVRSEVSRPRLAVRRSTQFVADGGLTNYAKRRHVTCSPLSLSAFRRLFRSKCDVGTIIAIQSDVVIENILPTYE
jgi:hypothetical protein